MRPQLTCMLPLTLTLAVSLSGYKASSAWLQMRMDALQFCTIAITWLQPLVTQNGSHRLLGKFRRLGEIHHGCSGCQLDSFQTPARHLAQSLIPGSALQWQWCRSQTKHGHCWAKSVPIFVSLQHLRQLEGYPLTRGICPYAGQATGPQQPYRKLESIALAESHTRLHDR